MYLGIQKRLLIYILSITTLFLVGIGILNYIWTEKVVVDLSEKRAATMADAAAAQIESYLLQKGQLAWTMAQDEYIHSFVQNLDSRYQDMSDDEDYKNLITSFKRIVHQDPDINIAYIAVEKTQRVYDSTEYENPPEYLVSSRPWYKEAVSARGLVYSSPYICPVSGKNVVSAAVPFYDDDGNLMGVAAVEILVDKIEKIVSDVHLFQSGYSFMLGAGKKVIYCPSEEHLQRVEDSINNHEEGVGKHTDRMVRGEKGLGRIVATGVEKYLFYTPISKVGWSLGVVVPRSEVTEALIPLGRISCITVVVGLLIITMIVIILTSRITRPVNEFTQIMGKVKDGDYTVRARVNAKDEVGELGESLNQMLDRQQNLIEQVITTAYNMGIAGHELAIIIGEGRALIPTVTAELSEIMGKLNIKELKPDGNRYSPMSVRSLFEEIILLNYKNRSLLMAMKEIEQWISNQKNHYKEQSTKIPVEWIEKNFNYISEKIVDIAQSAEELQMSFIDMSESIENRLQSVMDIMNTLEIVNKQINTISEIQADLLKRVSSTSMGLSEWSQSLLELTSSFNIGGWPRNSSLQEICSEEI